MRQHVYYYTHVHGPFATVEAAFAGWRPGGAGAGDTVARVHLDGAHPRGRPDARVRVCAGPCVRGEGRAVRDLYWEPVDDHLLPAGEGELQLLAMTTDTAQLSLYGSCLPPLQTAGALALVQGRLLAQAVVRGLVERLAATLRWGTVGA